MSPACSELCCWLHVLAADLYRLVLAGQELGLLDTVQLLSRSLMACRDYLAKIADVGIARVLTGTHMNSLTSTGTFAWVRTACPLHGCAVCAVLALACVLYVDHVCIRDEACLTCHAPIQRLHLAGWLYASCALHCLFLCAQSAFSAQHTISVCLQTSSKP